MIKIRIRLFATLREKYGVDEVIVELDEGDFKKAIEKAGLILGEDFIHEVFNGENYRSDRLILVNGRHIQFLNDTRLKDGDVIAIFPPIAGG